MNLKCLFGHHWDGCKCTKCGATRKQESTELLSPTKETNPKPLKTTLKTGHFLRKRPDITELISAIRDSNVDQVKTLLSKGADSNAANLDGIIPLQVAYSTLLRIVVELKSWCSESHHYYLTGAHDRGWETVELLLLHGTNSKNAAGTDFLLSAMRENRFTLAKLLIENGADVQANYKGNSVLHMAVGSCHSELVELLLKKGADPYFKDNDSKPPFFYTIYYEIPYGPRYHLGIATLFIRYGVPVKSFDYRMQPYLLIEAVKNNDSGLVELLLNQGLDVNTTGLCDETPLHAAADHNSFKSAEILLKFGANLHARDDSGNTPLHVAASNDSREVADVLLKHGADPFCMGRGGATPFKMANNLFSKGKVAELLIKRGADIESIDIYQAAEHNKAEMVWMVYKVKGAVIVTEALQVLASNNISAAKILTMLGDYRGIEPLLKSAAQTHEAIKTIFYIDNQVAEPSVNACMQLFSECLSYTTNSIETVGGDYSKGYNIFSIENALASARQLANGRIPISNNLLHLLKEVPDRKVIVSWDGGHPTKCKNDWSDLSFAPIRDLAAAELKKRRNPPYNTATFLKPEAYR